MLHTMNNTPKETDNRLHLEVAPHVDQWHHLKVLGICGSGQGFWELWINGGTGFGHFPSESWDASDAANAWVLANIQSYSAYKFKGRC